jgi:hypothetical protein
VIVEALFPQTTAVRFLKGESGALFEETNEFAEVGTVMRAFRKNVKVVGHQAIRVQQERVSSGALEKEIKDVFGDRWLAEKERVLVAADGDEICLAAVVILWR